MFRISIYEIIVGGIPLLAFAWLAKGYPTDVQCLWALWGGWLGIFAWFVILRLEYINPIKFAVIFMLVPGFLLASSYYVHEKPGALADFEAGKRPPVWQSLQTGEEPEGILPVEKRAVFLGLARESGWIWLTGSALACLLLSGMFGRLKRRFDYSLSDGHRSRSLLGRSSSRLCIGDGSRSINEICRDRMTPPSDVAADPRLREPVDTKY